MKAYHNDPAIKQEYLARVEAHINADEIVKGQYWKNGKGSAVGCTIHGSDYIRYEADLGIPEWLARLEDDLFENMSDDKAKTWPKKFLEAINVGADLEQAKTPFLLVVLRSALETQEQNTNFEAEKYPDVAGAVEGCKKVLRDLIELYERGNPTDDELYAARSAGMGARSAAWSAESAARSAGMDAWSAESAAESAALSAESAAESAALSAGMDAWSAWSAAWFAESAALSAGMVARSAKHNHFADELLKILKSLG